MTQKKNTPTKYETRPTADPMTDSEEEVEVSSPPPQQATKKAKTDTEKNYPGNPPAEEVRWYKEFYEDFDGLKDAVENQNKYVYEHMVPPR